MVFHETFVIAFILCVFGNYRLLRAGCLCQNKLFHIITSHWIAVSTILSSMLHILSIAFIEADYRFLGMSLALDCAQSSMTKHNIKSTSCQLMTSLLKRPLSRSEKFLQ